MVRPPCCDKSSVKRGLWTAEEDAKMLAHVAKHGTGNWTSVPKKAGLRRCGKSCRLRWTNYLRPDLNHDRFTPQEEEMIIRLHAAIGSRWSIIAQQLPGRTDNDVKNYWNARLRKKLSEMGIDPVTHKPFSKILADYGEIGGLLKSGSRTGSLSRDLKNVFTLKPERNPFTPEGISTISSHLMTAEVPPKTEPNQECFSSDRYINGSHLMTAEVPPKTEPNQECFSSDKYINGSNQNHSLDLLDQLQAVKLVTEEASSSRTAYQTIPAPCILDEGSSSSSTCSTAAQEKLPASFSWCDFLLEDEYLPCDHPQAEQENAADFSSKNPNAMVPQCVESNVGSVNGMDLALPSNTGSDDHRTFVEAIIDGESKIFLDFPNLLEEIFHN